MINLEDFDYKTECEYVLSNLKEEKKRIFSYCECEYEHDFLGFLNIYKDLSERLPKDIIIIDIGSYQAAQAVYFKDFAEYIAVEPYVPKEYILHQSNMSIYNMTGQQFISDILPTLEDKTVFCICSYVPDDGLMKLIPEYFQNYRIYYPEYLAEEKILIA